MITKTKFDGQYTGSIKQDARQFTSDLAHFQVCVKFSCVHDTIPISRPILIKFGT